MVALLAVFSLSSHRIAGRKPLWYDENNGFRQVVQNQSMTSLLLEGATRQASPAPLDYMLIKVLVGFRGPLGYLGMQPHQYLRTHYLVILWVVLLYLFVRIAAIERSPLVWLFVFAAAALILKQVIVWYAAEMRFYSLWATLSFAVLVLHEHRARLPWAWAMGILALACTTTGAIVQLSVLLAAMTAGWWLARRSPRRMGGPDIGFLIVLVGIAAGGYYILRIPEYMHYPESFWPTWGEFFAFWKNYVPFLIVGLLLSVYHARARNVGRFVATVAASGWIGAGPVWFYLLLKSEFFFAPRQLIYYHAVIAFLVYEMARVVFLDLRIEHRYRRTSVVVGVVLLAALVGPGMVKGTRFLLRNLERNHAPAVPANFESMAALLPDRIPAAYDWVPVGKAPAAGGRGWWDEEAMNETAELNLRLFWDWLEMTYPRERFPRDRATRLRLRAYDAYPACQAPCGSVFVEGLIRQD
jgi:hypothetical protein